MARAGVFFASDLPTIFRSRSDPIGTTISRGSALKPEAWPVWLREASAEVPQFKALFALRFRKR
jgi:hypothetical protein